MSKKKETESKCTLCKYFANPRKNIFTKVKINLGPWFFSLTFYLVKLTSCLYVSFHDLMIYHCLSLQSMFPLSSPISKPSTLPVFPIVIHMTYYLPLSRCRRSLSFIPTFSLPFSPHHPILSKTIPVLSSLSVSLCHISLILPPDWNKISFVLYAPACSIRPSLISSFPFPLISKGLAMLLHLKWSCKTVLSS